MRLIKRRPRPLRRDSEALRDDRLFIVACEDRYAPKQYFGFFRLKRIQIHVFESTEGEAAERVVDRLKAIEHEPDDERWLLLDTDHFTQDTHLRSFTRALQEARRAEIQVALSKPCFELWLLLHHLPETEVAALANAGEVAAEHKRVAGKYNKSNLNKNHYPPQAVKDACQRAQRLDQSVGGGDIPAANTTRVYQLWRSILSKTHRSQLLPELRDVFTS